MKTAEQIIQRILDDIHGTKPEDKNLLDIGIQLLIDYFILVSMLKGFNITLTWYAPIFIILSIRRLAYLFVGRRYV